MKHSVKVVIWVFMNMPVFGQTDVISALFWPINEAHWLEASLIKL